MKWGLLRGIVWIISRGSLDERGTLVRRELIKMQAAFFASSANGKGGVEHNKVGEILKTKSGDTNEYCHICSFVQDGL